MLFWLSMHEHLEPNRIFSKIWKSLLLQMFWILYYGCWLVMRSLKVYRISLSLRINVAVYYACLFITWHMSRNYYVYHWIVLRNFICLAFVYILLIQIFFFLLAELGALNHQVQLNCLLELVFLFTLNCWIKCLIIKKNYHSVQIKFTQSTYIFLNSTLFMK